MSDPRHEPDVDDEMTEDAAGTPRPPIEPGPEPDTTDAATPDDVDAPLRPEVEPPALLNPDGAPVSEEEARQATEETRLEP